LFNLENSVKLKDSISYLNAMNLIVTGGAGFIGSHLTEYLVKKHQNVTVIDNLENGKLQNLRNVKNDIKFFKVNILDYDSLRKIVKNADCVFHYAALTSVSDSFTKQEKYYNVNVSGTENILKLAKEFGFKVVFASSASVYGDQKQIPIKENAKKNPSNPYGLTKLKAEELCIKYAKKGVSVIVLRYFNVYGLRQNVSYAGVISKFLANISKNKPPIINGDGTQARDFVFVGDVSRANYLSMKSHIKHAFVNIGSGKTTSIKQLADLMIKIRGIDLQPIYGITQKGDIKLSQADITVAKKLLSWKPKMSLSGWLKTNLHKE
jgi:UDP-glucose 4-epimerase